MFAGLIFFLTFLQYESPRFLVKQGKAAQALAIMSRLRHLPEDHDYVVREVNAIILVHHEEMEATIGAGGLGVVKEMFLVKSNLYRLYLTLMSQIMSQWSGARLHYFVRTGSCLAYSALRATTRRFSLPPSLV